MATILYADGRQEPLVLAATWQRLEQYQKIVGGYIEYTYLRKGVLVINEEGKLHGLPFNQQATEIYNNPNDHIVGDAVLLSVEELQQECEE